VDAARPSPSSASALVLAIDGPSGSGKSSVSRAVAGRLGLRYLDTGAMYRAATLWMLRHGVDVDDASAVAAHASSPTIFIGTDPAAPAVTLDGVDVSGLIRTPPVTRAVSAVSAVPAVRRRLVAEQHAIVASGSSGSSGGIVVEGRDIGTVVAPDAAVKVFLTASPNARAQRRTAERIDPSASVQATLADLDRRDRFDSTRAASPLEQAPDAVVVDATDLSLEEVIEAVVDLVRSRIPVSWAPPAGRRS
jgi:CMP/dCMP kinase